MVRKLGMRSERKRLRRIGGIVAVLASCAAAVGGPLAGAAPAAQPNVAECGVVAHPLAGASGVFAYYASVIARGSDCPSATAVAEHWYANLDARAIPDRIFSGDQGQFGPAYELDGYRCRFRRLGSDISDVRCDAVSKSGAVVMWAHHRGLADAPEDPHYPRIQAPKLTRPGAESALGVAASRRFKAAYDQAENPRTRCVRTSRVRFRCQISWFIGDASYDGTGRVRLVHAADGADHTRVEARITVFDEYCASVTPRHDCAKTYILHA